MQLVAAAGALLFSLGMLVVGARWLSLDDDDDRCKPLTWLTLPQFLVVQAVVGLTVAGHQAFSAFWRLKMGDRYEKYAHGRLFLRRCAEQLLDCVAWAFLAAWSIVGFVATARSRDLNTEDGCAHAVVHTCLAAAAVGFGAFLCTALGSLCWTCLGVAGGGGLPK